MTQINANREQFFDMFEQKLKEMRDDDRVSHVFMFVVYGNDPNAVEGEPLETFFVHNGGDNLTAAQTCNQITVQVMLHELEQRNTPTMN